MSEGNFRSNIQSGCIVNLSSMGAFLNRGAGAYSLAKRAIIDITMAAATDYGPHGVRVNAIAPGVIMTDMTAGMRSLPGIVEFYEKMTPLGRLGELRTSPTPRCCSHRTPPASLPARPSWSTVASFPWTCATCRRPTASTPTPTGSRP